MLKSIAIGNFVLSNGKNSPLSKERGLLYNERGSQEESTSLDDVFIFLNCFAVHAIDREKQYSQSPPLGKWSGYGIERELLQNLRF